MILKANIFKLNPEEIDGFKYSLKCCNRYTNKNYPFFGSVVMCINIEKLLKKGFSKEQIEDILN